jgi:hypothetical protein
MALAVLLACGAAYAESQLDQEHTGVPHGYGDVNGCIAWAQTFSAGDTGLLPRVSLYLSRDSNPTDPASVSSPLTVDLRPLTLASTPEGDIVLTLEGDMSGQGGTVLARDQITYDAIPDFPGRWVDIAFSPEPVVIQGGKYALVAFSDAPCQNGPYLWNEDGTYQDDEYNRGEQWKYEPASGQGWVRLETASDFYFRTYVTPDHTAPTGTVLINGGARRTNTRTVTLTLNAADEEGGTGLTSMRIKNAGRKWGAWQPYAETKRWKLTRGAGKKIVHVVYRDAAGSGSAAVSDSIRYRP